MPQLDPDNPVVIAMSEAQYARQLRIAALRQQADGLRLEAASEPDADYRATLLEEALHTMAAALEVATEGRR
jgi:hypothetical protein